MADLSELKGILDRLAEGTQTDDDLNALRRALATGQVSVATGDGAVAVGGDVNDTVIVTGDGSVVRVFRGPDAATLQDIVGQALEARREWWHYLLAAAPTFFRRHWPTVLAVLIPQSLLVIAYAVLDQIVWIRRWVLLACLILVGTIAGTLSTFIRVQKARRRWRPYAALAAGAFLVVVGIGAWQGYWIFGSPWRAIALAQFDGSNATNRANVQDDIYKSMRGAGIPRDQIVRLGLVTDPETALRLGRRHRTKIVMWGWYNDLEISPNFEVVRQLPRVHLGETYAGSSEEELRAFRTYLSRDLPSELTALGLMTLGVIEYYEGRYEPALRKLGEAEDVLPETGRTLSLRLLHLFRGNALRCLERYAEAIEAFDLGIGVEDERDNADRGDEVGVFLYNQRGAAYHGLREYEKAVADYSQALEWDPEQPTVLYNRGSAYYALLQRDEALADFDRALEVDPAFTWAPFVYVMRSAIYVELGRHNEALAEADRAVEADPDLPSAYGARAIACFHLKRPEMARQAADEAIGLWPDYVTAYYYRGRSLEDLQDPVAALADYETVLDLCAATGSEGSARLVVQCDAFGEEALRRKRQLQGQEP